MPPINYVTFKNLRSSTYFLRCVVICWFIQELLCRYKYAQNTIFCFFKDRTNEFHGSETLLRSDFILGSREISGIFFEIEKFLDMFTWAVILSAPSYNISLRFVSRWSPEILNTIQNFRVKCYWFCPASKCHASRRYVVGIRRYYIKYVFVTSSQIAT